MYTDKIILIYKCISVLSSVVVVAHAFFSFTFFSFAVVEATASFARNVCLVFSEVAEFVLDSMSFPRIILCEHEHARKMLSLISVLTEPGKSLSNPVALLYDSRMYPIFHAIPTPNNEVFFSFRMK